LKKERRLRVFEEDTGPKRDDVTGEWRKRHKKELRDLHSSPNVILVKKLRRWAGRVTRMGDKTGTYRVLVGTHEGKRLIGRPRHRWEGNNKLNLQEVGCTGMGWIDLAGVRTDGGRL
jgi:hypothetical protein